jgi:N-formylglutamate deformylase
VTGEVVPVVEGAFVLRTPAIPTTPVVVSVPHAGLATHGYEATMSPGLDVRCDADLHVDRLYRVGGPDAPEVNLAARLSRFVCDLNRDPDDVTRRAVPGHPAPCNGDGSGFVWAVTTAGAPALARPLTLDEWRARTALHAAYHDAVARALDRARARFGFAVLVDGHSMPSRGRSSRAAGRADVVPGDRDGTSCAPGLSRLVREHFASRGYSVAFNDPYRGGYITAHHGRPAAHKHAIQLEVRRDLYMDESTYEIVEPGFTRLQASLAELLTKLREWSPPRP